MTHAERAKIASQSARSLIAPPRFYTINVVADFLGVSPRTVRRWIRIEALRAHRFGRIRRISHDAVEEFIARHEDRNEGKSRAVFSSFVSGLQPVGKTSIK